VSDDGGFGDDGLGDDGSGDDELGDGSGTDVDSRKGLPKTSTTCWT